MSVSRDELHKLVDTLPEEKADKALQMLRRLVDQQRDEDESRRQRRKKPWSGEGLLSMVGIAEGPPDLAERHDDYLAQAIEEETRRR